MQWIRYEEIIRIDLYKNWSYFKSRVQLKCAEKTRYYDNIYLINAACCLKTLIAHVSVIVNLIRIIKKK